MNGQQFDPLSIQQAQQACILCTPERTMLEALVDEVEKHLAGQRATILLYGIQHKRPEGFIVVEAAQGFPSSLRRWLKNDPRVFGLCIYDVPCYGPQGLVMSAAQAAEWYRPNPHHGAPEVPAGYSLLAGPDPVDRPTDENWIAHVVSENPDLGEGILLYAEKQPLAFWTAEEALNMLAYLLKRGRPLLAACSEAYMFASEHAERLIDIQSALAAIASTRAKEQAIAEAIERFVRQLGSGQKFRILLDNDSGKLHLVPEEDENEEGE